MKLKLFLYILLFAFLNANSQDFRRKNFALFSYNFYLPDGYNFKILDSKFQNENTVKGFSVFHKVVKHYLYKKIESALKDNLRARILKLHILKNNIKYDNVGFPVDKFENALKFTQVPYFLSLNIELYSDIDSVEILYKDIYTIDENQEEDDDFQDPYEILYYEYSPNGILNLQITATIYDRKKNIVKKIFAEEKSKGVIDFKKNILYGILTNKKMENVKKPKDEKTFSILIKNTIAKFKLEMRN